MHATDYQSRTPRKHRHAWYRLDDDSPDTMRCECGARCGKLSLEAYSNMLNPPGVSPGVAQGKPPMQAPRLPANWRGK